MMAKGAYHLRNMLEEDIVSFAEHDDIQKRLDDFYMSRIGIRMVRDKTSNAVCSHLLNISIAVDRSVSSSAQAL
jgi:hypothetical protein